MEAIEFEPRVAPRSTLDFVLSTVVGLALVALLFVLPSFIFYCLTGNGEIAVAIGVLLSVAFSLFSVSKLRVDSDGLRFVRMFGAPKLIRWHDVTAISEVERGELIVSGWLWPLFPPREFTPSYTSIGHYRIQYGRNHVYFPPKDAQAFMRAISIYFPKLPA